MEKKSRIDLAETKLEETVEKFRNKYLKKNNFRKRKKKKEDRVEKKRKHSKIGLVGTESLKKQTVEIKT